jgi:glycolate oxidase
MPAMKQNTGGGIGITEQVLGKLNEILGPGGVIRSEADLIAYAYDGTSNWFSKPEVVVFPTSAQQISRVMILANEHRIPVTVRGAGTNVSGGSIPVMGGIVLCTTRMNRIISVDAENFTATVEAGVVLNDFNKELARRNLFFPPDPQSFLVATIGGCISENAGGPYAVKYGIFKHYLLGMTVVLPSGAILKLGGSTVKNVVGFDLCSLICGSEGTLAVIVDVTLRLLTRPPAKQTVMAAFDKIKNAGKAVHLVLSKGITPAKIELMDNWVVNRIEENSPLGLPVHAEAMLLFEMDGEPELVKKETAFVLEQCQCAGAIEVRAAQDSREADTFWAARRAGFSAVFGNAPTVLAEDVTVPTSRIPDLIERVKEIGKENDVTIAIIGHAGDGNLHPSVLTDKDNPEHYKRAEKAIAGIFDAALEFGGVISGEHGIGLEKKAFLKKALQPEAIELLKQLKSVFDPQGILNPGKIWE